MLFIIASALGLAAVLLAFYSPVVSWILLALPGAYLFAVYWLLRRKELKAAIPELSPRANELLVRFPHFYMNPSANRTISGAASALAAAGVIVAVVDCFRDFWWGLLIGALYLVVTAKLATAFEPKSFLRDEAEKQAHNEIMKHFAGKGWL
ncbi:MAG: hypothetical protein ACRD3T_08230 [Terriglobia bacterium]